MRTAEEQQVLCQRCHEAEVNEWRSNTGAHSQYAEDTGYNCFCHQINSSELATDWGLAGVNDYGFIHWNASGDVLDAGNWTFRPDTTPHAALTVLCVDCHTNASTQLENEASAHKLFYESVKNKPEGSNNTACMACHTHIGLNISMSRIESGLEIHANHTGYVDPMWTVNASVNTTQRTTNSTYWAPGEIPT